MTTRQYARLLADWLVGIGLDPHVYGTHSLRRTKATLIYRRTGNLRAVQLLLGHTKIESTVRYLGIYIDDALAISELRHLSASPRAARLLRRRDSTMSAFADALGGRIQPVDATPFASNLARWIGMHMSGMHGHVHAEAED